MREINVRVHIVTPAPKGSNTGNRVTAERWARIICSLGYRVRVSTDYESEPCDLLVALHARKSARAAARFKSINPRSPLVVCLTGTDLYGAIHTSRVAQQTIELATRLVGLHPTAVEQLPVHLRKRFCVIHQSARPCQPPPRQTDTFTVAVIGHLRHVKDPFRAAMACRSLPNDSRVRVVLVGAALNESMRQRAIAEQSRNLRFTWLGEQSRVEAKRTLAASHLTVLSSRSEGGANVVSEAVMCSVPLLASRIPSSVDLLGKDYPGLFSVGDTSELRSLILRCEHDREFYDDLNAWLSQLRETFHPRREYDSWRRLLAEVATEL